ncbi:hypothetical protein BKA56DRAFT_237343 [Ilyonectria sp. MPI-CAGE-AT-0026]|nr:hypothetical protein BKA56DRAFT_237343 [Ilyonectria sp. MPI-CAGE-AT-0026]
MLFPSLWQSLRRGNPTTRPMRLAQLASSAVWPHISPKNHHSAPAGPQVPCGRFVADDGAVPGAVQRLPGLLRPWQHQDALLHHPSPSRLPSCSPRLPTLESPRSSRDVWAFHRSLQHWRISPSSRLYSPDRSQCCYCRYHRSRGRPVVREGRHRQYNPRPGLSRRGSRDCVLLKGLGISTTSIRAGERSSYFAPLAGWFNMYNGHYATPTQDFGATYLAYKRALLGFIR